MRISGSPRSRVIAATVVVLALVAALVGWTVGHAPRPDRTTPVAGSAVVGDAAGSVSVVGAVSALAVLRDWDLARSEAWAAGDVGALRALYVVGARVGERDARMLRAWRERGMRVEGMAMQVVAVELRRRTPTRIVLVVTDRLAGARAVPVDEAGRRIDLPRDAETTRRLVFHRADGFWRMASAQQVAAQDASAQDASAQDASAQDVPASPVRSTEVTSGSAKS